MKRTITISIPDNLYEAIKFDAEKEMRSARTQIVFELLQVYADFLKIKPEIYQPVSNNNCIYQGCKNLKINSSGLCAQHQSKKPAYDSK